MGNSCFSVGKCLFPPSKIPVVECIQQLQRVEHTLELLVEKYDRQIAQEKQKARKKLHKKKECLRHVKTIHVIRYHKQKLENRLTSCLNKRYHLESLNVTKMHIEAVKLTTQTFTAFLKDNDIEKVERLQEALAEMIEDACEINETLSTPTGSYEVDDSDIEDEYEQMCSDIQMPEAPRHLPLWSSLEMTTDEEEVVPLAL